MRQVICINFVSPIYLLNDLCNSKLKSNYMILSSVIENGN